MDDEVVRLEPRQFEQVGHEPVEPLRLGDERRADPGDVRLLHQSVGHGLAVTAHGGERGAQFVRDGQQEFALPPLARGEGRVEGGEGIRHVRDLGRPVHGRGEPAFAGGHPPGRGGHLHQWPRQPAAQQHPGEDRHGDTDQERPSDPLRGVASRLLEAVLAAHHDDPGSGGGATTLHHDRRSPFALHQGDRPAGEHTPRQRGTDVGGAVAGDTAIRADVRDRAVGGSCFGRGLREHVGLRRQLRFRVGERGCAHQLQRDEPGHQNGEHGNGDSDQRDPAAERAQPGHARATL